MMSFLAESAKWIKDGKPLRPKDEVSRIYNDVCSPCREFRKLPGGGGQCKICWCFLHPSSKSRNKLAWATTSCPHLTPKWAPWSTQEHENVG